MKKKLRLLLLLVAAICTCNIAMADNYTVNTGESINIYCTAEAPAGGWITHAFYELADASDSQYLALYSHSSDCYATITGISAKASVKIQVTYSYSYLGSYDNKVHVGHGTYYDYVTVKGGGAATDFRFNPSGVNMKVGETVRVKMELTPSNSSSTYQWGIIESISSRPSSYEITQSGNVLSITAKRAMSLYLYAETSNGLQATCVIYAKNDTPDDAVSPTGILVEPANVVLREGDNRQLSYALTPENASTAITWQSSDENVCTVSGTGELTALQSGQAIITATTSNGLQASCNVTVGAKLQSVTLPNSERVTLGYQIRLVPTAIPAGAVAEWLWQSSDESVATVDANGLVMARREGTARITVKAKESDASAVCAVTVVAAAKGTDLRNVKRRTQVVDDLINQTLRQIK